MLELVLETERDPNRFVNSMIDQIAYLVDLTLLTAIFQAYESVLSFC